MSLGSGLCYKNGMVAVRRHFTLEDGSSAHFLCYWHGVLFVLLLALAGLPQQPGAKVAWQKEDSGV